MKSLRRILLRDAHICPWWLAYTFDNPLRPCFHNTQELLGPYLKEGMIALDLGCGMGFFTRGMARLVGDTGRVISVDVQSKMLEILLKRARKDGTTHRIRTRLAVQGDIGVTEQADFALAFWMAHEVEAPRVFFAQVFSALKQSGTLLLAEPRMHVSPERFTELVSLARDAGFSVVEAPRIRFSRAVAMKK